MDAEQIPFNPEENLPPPEESKPKAPTRRGFFREASKVAKIAAAATAGKLLENYFITRKIRGLKPDTKEYDFEALVEETEDKLLSEYRGLLLTQGSGKLVKHSESEPLEVDSVDQVGSRLLPAMEKIQRLYFSAEQRKKRFANLKEAAIWGGALGAVLVDIKDRLMKKEPDEGEEGMNRRKFFAHFGMGIGMAMGTAKNLIEGARAGIGPESDEELALEAYARSAALLLEDRLNEVEWKRKQQEAPDQVERWKMSLALMSEKGDRFSKDLHLRRNLDKFAAAFYILEKEDELSSEE